MAGGDLSVGRPLYQDVLKTSSARQHQSARRVENLDEIESMKVSVSRVYPPESVLAHENRDVGVMPPVSGDVRVLLNLFREN